MMISTKKTILLVEDDILIVDSLMYSLQKEHFQVITTGDGLEAITLAEQKQPDLILLDIMLPTLDGWEVCRQIRQTSVVPIIMLTAKGDEFDRVLGLEIGADDYLPKPFSFRELLARIRAIFRRQEFDRQRQAHKIISVGNIRLDETAHQLYNGDAPLTVTQKEYDLLRTLMSRSGEVITRNELFDIIWGTDWVGDHRTLDVHIRWLREKIEINPSRPKYIQTVRGVGYRFATNKEL
ncbi:response regulator transcription factor [Anaerolineales bacterium HSG6]|nr:response regulator transcription factor [Anaerolineales bacterium HSG6]MDM8532032.1 response regulator transcription factor [Anaerolineales bacterium HSG25]